MIESTFNHIGNSKSEINAGDCPQTEHFYKGKRVWITGHTGFKGTWLCKILLELGAEVGGYALEPNEEQLLFEMSDIKPHITNIYGNICDLEKLTKEMKSFNPDIVIHMAAQPLVRESYRNPVETYHTNVLGTVNILEAVRQCVNVKSVINVTTDKVYKNLETDMAYKETDILDGFDPYSNSKSCSELVTNGYKNSFFRDTDVAISTCRAGNVIGGGDFSKDRIIPDCVKAAIAGEKIEIRNPYSTRPYQHVLDPLGAYLLVAKRQYADKASFEGSYNIGPDAGENMTTKDLVELFCRVWGDNTGYTVRQEQNVLHEAKLLSLDCTKAKNVLLWSKAWDMEKTVEKTVEWYKVYAKCGDINACMENQIKEFWRKKEYVV